MNDPDRYGPADRQNTEPAQAPTGQYPPYPDPAYAGQVPTYGPTYPPAYAPGPPQPPWAYGPPTPPGQPPVTGAEPSQPPQPEPPGSPRWLWLLAGAAVLLVVGLVVALVVVNGSTDKSATVSPVPETPTTKAGTPPPAPPTVPRKPGTVPTVPPPSASPTEPGPPTTTVPGQTDSVVYNVTGDGRAISIIYIDTDAVVQTEFNVPLPWSKEVSLPSSASNMASLTVANIGPEVTCSVAVNGTRVSERTGSVLTVCTPGR